MKPYPASGGASGPFASIYLAANIANHFVTGTLTAIPFDTEEYDASGLWVIGSPTRITVTQAGFYLVQGQVNFAASAAGYRQATIKRNADAKPRVASLSGVPNIGAFGMYIPVEGLTYLDAGDFVELCGAQTSGGNLAAVGAAGGGADACHLKIVKVA